LIPPAECDVAADDLTLKAAAAERQIREYWYVADILAEMFPRMNVDPQPGVDPSRYVPAS